MELTKKYTVVKNKKHLDILIKIFEEKGYSYGRNKWTMKDINVLYEMDEENTITEFIIDPSEKRVNVIQSMDIITSFGKSWWEVDDKMYDKLIKDYKNKNKNKKNKSNVPYIIFGALVLGTLIIKNLGE